MALEAVIVKSPSTVYCDAGVSYVIRHNMQRCIIKSIFDGNQMSFTALYSIVHRIINTTVTVFTVEVSTVHYITPIPPEVVVSIYFELDEEQIKIGTVFCHQYFLELCVLTLGIHLTTENTCNHSYTTQIEHQSRLYTRIVIYNCI